MDILGEKAFPDDWFKETHALNIAKSDLIFIVISTLTRPLHNFQFGSLDVLSRSTPRIVIGFRRFWIRVRFSVGLSSCDGAPIKTSLHQDTRTQVRSLYLKSLCIWLVLNSSEVRGR